MNDGSLVSTSHLVIPWEPVGIVFVSVLPAMIVRRKKLDSLEQEEEDHHVE